MFEFHELPITITLTEECLGMSPSDPDIYDAYIGSKAPDAMTREEEVAALGVQEVIEQGKTIFHRMPDGTPFIYGYQIRGFLKDSIGLLRRAPKTESSKVKAYKKIVDGMLMVKERQIPIRIPREGAVGQCQRPLRIDGPTGSRTALANSETVPAGSTMDVTILMLDKALEPLVVECLDYGAWHGLGQWRNSGKGTFTWAKRR